MSSDGLDRRMLNAERAAAYCGYDNMTDFWALVKFSPTFPKSRARKCYRGGQAKDGHPLWDRKDLDAWLDAEGAPERARREWAKAKADEIMGGAA